MRSTAVVVLLFAWVGGAAAMTDVYQVEPVKASWSGKVWGNPIGGGVSQVITLNVDTLKQVDVFIGFNEGEEDYNVNVYSYPGGVTELAQKLNKPFSRPHAWMSCTLSLVHPDSFVKGRQYRIEFRRGQDDSINYYWQEGQSVYPWGFMMEGVDSTVPIKQLACRVTGVMDVVDSVFSAFNLGHPPPVESTAWRDTVAALCRNAGIDRARHSMEWSSSAPSSDSLNFGKLKSWFAYRQDTMGCDDVFAFLYPCPGWASTHWGILRIDTTVVSNDTTIDTIWGYSEQAPPTNLWAGGDTNHVTRYVKAAVDSVFGDDVHVWQCWNEPNHLTRFWKLPNDRQYLDCSTVRERCSLYVRMCWLMHTVIKDSLERTDDVLLVGSMSQVDASFANPPDSLHPEGDTLIMGKEWLRLCYQIALNEPGYIFWDGVAVHPYQPGLAFTPSKFRADAETLRNIMRQFGHDDGQLWATELGWGRKNHSEQNRG